MKKTKPGDKPETQPAGAPPSGKESAKERKRPVARPLEYYIARLESAKAEAMPRILKSIDKFDRKEVLEKLSAFLSAASSIDALRNSHDAFVHYGAESVPYLETIAANPEERFDVIECVVFSLYAIGEKPKARSLLLQTYLRFKDDSSCNAQIIVDMFEMDLWKEAVDASTYHMSLDAESMGELLSILWEFFDEHLEIEAWLRKQTDNNSKLLIEAIDEVSDSVGEMTVVQNPIEFYKFEEFCQAPGDDGEMRETIFAYNLANTAANFITHYKQENDVDFLDYSKVKGFVFVLVMEAVKFVKSSADGGKKALLCDLDADASALFARDSHSGQYERLFSYFWEDMKLLYRNEQVAPINIDFFAWRMNCLVYGCLRDFIARNGGLVPEINNEDESFIRFVFNLAEEIAGNVEEFVSCGEGKSIFRIDDGTVEFFRQYLKKEKK